MRVGLERGQTLLEVVIALSIAVIVITLITLAIIYALNNATYGKNQNLATAFAQEGMEVVRQKRDVDLLSFNTLSGVYCLAKDSTTLTQKQIDCGQNVDIFKREVSIYTASSPFACPPKPPVTTKPLTKVTVTVSWSDSKCTSSDLYCHKVDLVSCLSN